MPTFDGSILDWKTFWEQFNVTVHDRSNRVYLQGWFSKVCDRRLFQIRRKAISCLKVHHEAHVRKILEIPNLKDGSGKELRHLHNITLQHLRALKAIYIWAMNPVGFSYTLKLDSNTVFDRCPSPYLTLQRNHKNDISQICCLICCEYWAAV